jgi:hypothetical protein
MPAPRPALAGTGCFKLAPELAQVLVAARALLLHDSCTWPIQAKSTVQTPVGRGLRARQCGMRRGRSRQNQWSEPPVGRGLRARQCGMRGPRSGQSRRCEWSIRNDTKVHSGGLFEVQAPHGRRWPKTHKTQRQEGISVSRHQARLNLSLRSRRQALDTLLDRRGFRGGELPPGPSSERETGRATRTANRNM